LVKYPRKAANLCGGRGQREPQLERETDLHDREEDETDGADAEVVVFLEHEGDGTKRQIEYAPCEPDP